MAEWFSASGPLVRDRQGREYIDFTSGVVVANVGHAHPEVVAAIAEMLQRPLLHCYRYEYEEKQRLRDRLAAFMRTSPSRVEFAVSGAEAVEMALRMSLRFARRSRRRCVGVFEGAFHGKTLGAALLSDIERYKAPYAGWEPAAVRRYSLPEAGTPFEHVLGEIEGDTPHLSAVFIECTQGSTLRNADPGFLKGLESLCRATGMLLVVDEIQTGFHRTGPRFAFERAAIRPDITLLGKGLTSSLPLGVVAMSERAAEWFDEAVDVATHVANPLAAAAALACLQIYETPAFERQRARAAASFQTLLARLAASVPGGLNVRYAGGLLGGIEFSSGSDGRRAAREFCERAAAAGVLLGGPIGVHRNVVKLAPPLTIDVDHLERASGVLSRAARAIVRGSVATAVSGGVLSNGS